VPANTGSQSVSVKVGNDTKYVSSGYTYVNSANTTTVSKVEPNIGPSFGGTPITITGTKLDTVTDVTVGGKTCKYVSNSATIYTCTIQEKADIPEEEKNAFVDISVNATAGNVELSKYFEYVKASRDPLKANVQIE
jgi:hypothetical protein